MGHLPSSSSRFVLFAGGSSFASLGPVSSSLSMFAFDLVWLLRPPFFLPSPPASFFAALFLFAAFFLPASESRLRFFDLDSELPSLPSSSSTSFSASSSSSSWTPAASMRSASSAAHGSGSSAIL